jgi:hypothetical protein
MLAHVEAVAVLGVDADLVRVEVSSNTFLAIAPYCRG